MKNSKNSLTSHLLELRSRLLIVISSILICALILSPFANHLYNLLALPLTDILPKGSSMIAVDVASPFLAPFKLILLLSVVITFPISIYNFWAFVSPGLYKNEKKAILPYLVSTPILFLLGGFLVYYLVMPLAIKFFLSFETIGSNSSLPIQLEAKVNEYLSLVMRLIFAFGISFQLPILLNLLARVGVVNSEYLRTRRRYVIVIIFALAAILTPPDPITQVGLAIPLLLLYELSILTVRITEKKNKEHIEDA